MRFYISGAISNLDYREALQNFQQIEDRLLAIGVKPSNIFNPMKEVDPTISYRAQMDICIANLERCDIIIMQNNWNESAGAREELTFAMKNGIIVRYTSSGDWRDIENIVTGKVARFAEKV